MPRAFQDLDEIYWYIVHELSVPETALNMVSELRNAILSLEEMPERGGAPRKYHSIILIKLSRDSIN